MMGNMLRERDQQYIAVRDEATKTWRLLDTWHETLSGYSVEDEVADDSPAIKILSEGEFIVLVREAARIGVLENAHLDSEDMGEETPEGDFLFVNEEQSSKLLEMEKELVQYKNDISLLEARNRELELDMQDKRSDGYRLKEMAMNSILKLTAMSDLDNLGKE